jgi:hypothetical protein
MIVATSGAIRDDPLSVEVDGYLAPGDAVEVRNRFDRRWARGFEITGVTDHGFRVRRLSDGRELPDEFVADDVRARRDRKRGTWWY